MPYIGAENEDIARGTVTPLDCFVEESSGEDVNDSMLHDHEHCLRHNLDFKTRDIKILYSIYLFLRDAFTGPFLLPAAA